MVFGVGFWFNFHLNCVCVWKLWRNCVFVLVEFKIEMKNCQKVKGKNLKVGNDEFINTICSEPFRQLANYVSV